MKDEVREKIEKVGDKAALKIKQYFTVLRTRLLSYGQRLIFFLAWEVFPARLRRLPFGHKLFPPASFSIQ